MRAAVQRALRGRKDRLVVHRQPQVPGLIERTDGIVGFGALVGHGRRPTAGEAGPVRVTAVELGFQLLAVIVQPRMKHHRRRNDEHRPLSGLVPPAAPALAEPGSFPGWEVECSGDFLFLVLAQPLDGGVEAGGEGRRGVVRVAQLHRRELDDGYQLVEVGVGPADLTYRGPEVRRPDGPKQPAVLQLVPRGDAVAVADGDGTVGVALVQPAVGIADGFPLLGAALALLGFQRDFDVTDVDFYVNAPPVGLLAFLPSIQPAATQQLGQPDVQGVLVLDVRSHGTHSIHFCRWIMPNNPDCSTAAVFGAAKARGSPAW